MPARLALPPLSPAKDPADYPVFSGAISRWIWRLYAQRLTPAGRWFALASAVFVAYGGITLTMQAYVIAMYAAGIWAIALAAVLIYRPRVRLAVRAATRVCAGETLPVDIEIEQRSRARGADLWIVPHQLPASIDSEPSDGLPLPDLALSRPQTVRLGLRCNRRGAFALRGVRVESSFPFGILRSRRMFRSETKLLVYPKFSPLARLELPTGRRYQPGGVALASEIGESFEYLGNREYREGDNVRDIDWRATARVSSQRPIVREWVEEYMLRVAVVLDTHVQARSKPSKAEAFERAVSIAAAVSDYMARQDYLVDLFAAGPDLYHLTAGRSLAYLDQILDILACVESTTVEPFQTIEPQLAQLLSRISTVICVFLDWTDARRAFVQRVLRYGVAVKLIVVHDGMPAINPMYDASFLGSVPVVSKADFDRGIDEL